MDNLFEGGRQKQQSRTKGKGLLNPNYYYQEDDEEEDIVELP